MWCPREGNTMNGQGGCEPPHNIITLDLGVFICFVDEYKQTIVLRVKVNSNESNVVDVHTQ
jgi:hypothetical protein